MRAILFSMLLLMASCASTVPPYQESQLYCLPPNAPSGFHEWPSMAMAVAMMDEDGAYFPVVRVLYKKGNEMISAVWYGGKLVVLDRAPSDYDVPVFYNSGLIIRVSKASIRIRRKPKPGCTWGTIRFTSEKEIQA